MKEDDRIECGVFGTDRPLGFKEEPPVGEFNGNTIFLDKSMRSRSFAIVLEFIGVATCNEEDTRFLLLSRSLSRFDVAGNGSAKLALLERVDRLLLFLLLF